MDSDLSQKLDVIGSALQLDLQVLQSRFAKHSSHVTSAHLVIPEKIVQMFWPLL